MWRLSFSYCFLIHGHIWRYLWPIIGTITFSRARTELEEKDYCFFTTTRFCKQKRHLVSQPINPSLPTNLTPTFIIHTTYTSPLAHICYQDVLAGGSVHCAASPLAFIIICYQEEVLAGGSVHCATSPLAFILFAIKK